MFYFGMGMDCLVRAVISLIFRWGAMTLGTCDSKCIHSAARSCVQAKPNTGQVRVGHIGATSVGQSKWVSSVVCGLYQDHACKVPLQLNTTNSSPM